MYVYGSVQTDADEDGFVAVRLEGHHRKIGAQCAASHNLTADQAISLPDTKH